MKKNNEIDLFYDLIKLSYAVLYSRASASAYSLIMIKIHIDILTENLFFFPWKYFICC